MIIEVVRADADVFFRFFNGHCPKFTSLLTLVTCPQKWPRKFGQCDK